MKTAFKARRTRPEMVYDRLHAMISRSGLQVGDRLQPVRALAASFETSVLSVHKALGMLEQDGLIDRRHGSGVFVASTVPPLDLQRGVALCFEAGTAVFGDLGAAIMGHLHDLDCPVSMIDTGHGQVAMLLARMAQTTISCFALHGNFHFFERIANAGVDLRGKRIVALLDWETSYDFGPVSGVLTDYPAGTGLLAAHLWELGHRHVLFCGTNTQIDDLHGDRMNVASQALHAWQQLGGRYSTFCSRTALDGTVSLAAEAFLAVFDRTDAPTAVFGLRDVEAHCAQILLRRHRPGLVARTAITGYYDTPWSLAGDPPITGVNLNLKEVAHLAAGQIAAIVDHPQAPPPPLVHVRPQLMVRGTSYRC